MATLVDRDPEELRAAIADARARGDRRALETLTAGLRAALRWQPDDHQRPPSGDWWTWLLQFGRAGGKTDTGAWWINEHMTGPPCDGRAPGGHYGVIIGPTAGDAITSCVLGVSGLQAHNPGIEHVNRRDGTHVIWPSGAEARVFGCHTPDDVARLRGGAAGGVCCWWIDEAAYAPHLEDTMLTLAGGARLGKRPRGIVTSTPKATAGFKALVRMPGVIVTRASTFDNTHNSQAFRDQVRAMFRDGSAYARQELYGELLDDFEGALWTTERIGAGRVDDPGQVPQLALIAIGIDPSAWSPETGRDDGTIARGAETGIVAVGIDRQVPAELWVLRDASGRHTAEGWAAITARLAGELAEQYRAPVIVVPEVNLNGPAVLATLRLTDPTVKIHTTGGKPGVRASDGKRARAEPVSALYDTDPPRVHHVGYHPGLEAQMTSWDPTLPWSPDRIDALVWAVYALAPWKAQGGGTAYDVIASMRSPARR